MGCTAFPTRPLALLTPDETMLHSSLCTPFYLSPGLLFGWRKLTNQTAAFLWALSEVDPARGGGRNKYNTGFGKQFTLSAAGLLVPKQGRSQREASLPRDAGHVWPRAQRLATCQKVERARLWPSQKQSYSLLLWKLLARLGHSDQARWT